MDKFYTLPTYQKSPKPSKKSVAIILHYAAAYNPIKLFKGYANTISN
jgi:hypothetical protein